MYEFSKVTFHQMPRSESVVGPDLEKYQEQILKLAEEEHNFRLNWSPFRDVPASKNATLEWSRARVNITLLRPFNINRST